MKAFNSGGALIITGVPAGGGGGTTFTAGLSNIGNTAGTTGLATDRLVLAGGNNITLSGSTNAGSMTITISGPNTVAGALTNINVSAGTTSNLLSALTFNNANGVSFGINASTLTASIATSLTNINVSAGTTSNLLSALTFNNANGISFGLNAGTITASYTVPTVTNSSWTVSDTATSGTVARLAFTNLNGITLSLSTGAAGSHTIVGSHNALTSQSNQAFSAAGGSSAFQTLSFSDNGYASWTNNAGQVALTELRGSFFATGNTTQSSSGSANLDSHIIRGDGLVSVGVTNGSIEISAQGLLAGVSNLGNTSGSTGTVSQGNFVLVGSNGITLSQSTGAAGSAATITISGDGFTASSTDLWAHYGASTQTTAIQGGTSGVNSIFPFLLDDYISAGVLNLLFTANFTTVGTSSGRQTAGLAVAVYSRNASTLSSIASRSFSWQVTGNNSSYTINQVTSTDNTGYGATGATNSAGVNITSGYTGVKVVGFPLNTLLSPGIYWLALVGTNSTSSVNVGMTMGFIGMVVATQETAAAPIGSFSTAYTTGQDQKGIFNVGLGSWTSAGSVTMVPVSMNFASITPGGTVVPLAKIWRT